MKASFCLLTAIVTLLDPAVAHFWPNSHHAFHSMPSDVIEQSAPFNPNGVLGAVGGQLPLHSLPSPPPLPSFAPVRHWKSDGVFLFRPLVMSAWNSGLPEQQRLQSPLLERLLSSPSPYRRSRFINFYKTLNMEQENGRRHRRRVRGMKGEINVKWAVMPIWERESGEEGASEGSDKQQPETLLRRSNRESMAFPSRRYSLYNTNSAPGEMQQPQQQQQQPTFGEDETAQETSFTSTILRRNRRQINFNMQPLLNRLLSNATGLFDTLGRQMSRQLHSSTDGAGRAMNGVFNSLQENFKRFTSNLNISQLRPERLLAQIASLAKNAQ